MDYGVSTSRLEFGVNRAKDVGVQKHVLSNPGSDLQSLSPLCSNLFPSFDSVFPLPLCCAQSSLVVLGDKIENFSQGDGLLLVCTIMPKETRLKKLLNILAIMPM